MQEADAEWLGTPGSPHPGSPIGASMSAPGHLDLSAAEASEDSGATLSPEAAHWAQSLLEVARFELARAEDKANTMFRFYGVVAALSIGLLAGRGWSPAELHPVSQVLFWLGSAALLASGIYLGRTLYPRDIRGTPQERLLYFGHVIAYKSVDELTAALQNVAEDTEHRLVEQLLSVSRLVHAKYALMRRALQALAAGTFLCIAAVVMDTVLR